MVVKAEKQFGTQLAILYIINIHIIKENQFENCTLHRLICSYIFIEHIHISNHGTDGTVLFAL